jgi:iron complex outermembrane receptor protein
LDYRVALDYDITEDVMVYGQVASGHKAGGNTARPFFPEQLNAFEPEELINYEVGVKSTLFDKLRLNAVVFLSEYSDIQLGTETCAFVEDEDKRSPCGSIVNAGNADVKGLEIDGMWRPTDAFSVDFSYAYMDFQYTYINSELTENITAESTTPYTPEHKWSIGAAYKFELGKGRGTITPRVDFAYQDDVFSGSDSTSTVIDAYYNSSGRVTWKSDDAKWEASLLVTNLLDEYNYLMLIPNFSGISFGTPLPPRQYAFSIKRYWFSD